MNICLKFFLSVAFSVGLTLTAAAQNKNYIYADVILKNKQVITGVVKWSGGQILWTDVLQVNKSNTLALKYLKKYQLEKLPGNSKAESLDWQFMNLWKDKLPERKKEILCRFGDIKSIHITGSRDAQVFYKSGSKIRISADQDDKNMGKDIVVYGKKTYKVSWNKISRINFRSTGSASLPWKGEPLYGTVYTSNGPITGFIRWDKTKFAKSNSLFGKSNDRTISVKFAQIKKIEKKNKGATITLHSDRQVYLHGSRDVSTSNKGIVVMDPHGGHVLIEWAAFKSVNFHGQETEVNYNTFVRPKRIYAEVFTTDESVLKGNCTFDMDEEWNFELLEGSLNHIHYQIPFNYISSIIPKNKNQSKVKLKNGKSLSLSGENDVTAKNWGLIIWLKNSKYEYRPWTEISKIFFR